MFFNSIEFAIFLPVVFAIYWVLPHDAIKLRNTFLIAASYYFYGCWDARFLLLIVLSSAIDYYSGLQLKRTAGPLTRRAWLVLSLSVNLGLLGYFKYFGFFVDSFAATFTWFGYPIETRTLGILLPAGISFYTFQTLSYTIDVYRRKLEPTNDVLAFFAFVAFFPQLVAGPIERATNLLPQFLTSHEFDPVAGRDALRQILWGLFKKCVIADNCGRYADMVFDNASGQPASALWMGAVLFAFQIYGDFSGYSDIAIGSARLFGFELSRNFASPYFATSPVDFWRRWHITLSTWFRDYVYFPLGGSRDGTSHTIRNIIIVFTVSGLWHGAAWTFVFWGLYHATGVLMATLAESLWQRLVGRSWVHHWLTVPATFLFVTVGWVLFRSPNLMFAKEYITGMFAITLFSQTPFFPPRILLLIIGMMGIEWLQQNRSHGLDLSGLRIPMPVRWAIYQTLIFMILAFGVPNQRFIYFQF